MAEKIIEGIKKVQVVPIDSISPDPRNARVHPARNLNAIKASLEAHGQRRAIVVNKTTGKIEAGEGVWRAAKELGWKKIAVAFVEEDELSALAFALADNRTNDLSTFDMELVRESLELLPIDQLPATGFTQEEFSLLSQEPVAPPPPSSSTSNEPSNEDDDPGVVSGTTQSRYIVYFAFASQEDAESWLSSQGFKERFKPGAKTLVIDMVGE